MFVIGKIWTNGSQKRIIKEINALIETNNLRDTRWRIIMKRMMKKTISVLLALILVFSMTMLVKEDVKAESPGDDFAATAIEYLKTQGSKVFYADKFVKDVYKDNGYFLGDLFRISGRVVDYSQIKSGDIVFFYVDGQEAFGIFCKEETRNDRIIYVPPGKNWLEQTNLFPGGETYDNLIQIRNYF